MKVAILIPAYDPDQQLLSLVRALIASVPKIIIVDDGSSPERAPIFDELRALDRVVVLSHAINMGKGAAIKTGVNYFLSSCPDYHGLVAVDADGQHSAPDALAIAAELGSHPDALVLGVRHFDRAVPLRSHLGNVITRKVTKIFFGLDISDTQTGLRGIPRVLVPMILTIPYNRYEFEMEMLLRCRRARVAIVEKPIRTIYLDKNVSSHFNPIKDSLRIYFVLFRYVLASLSTALIDYMAFFASYGWTREVLISTYTARLIALLYNYSILNKLVFRSTLGVWRTFPLYLTLVAISGFISVSIIAYLSRFTDNLLLTKMASELLLYLANFFIQKEIVFREETAG